MKQLLFTCALAFGTFALIAQPKYGTKTGKISFDAGTGLEDILAENKGVSSAINAKTGKIQFKMTITGFEFKRQLMQDHFNENYMESEKFPEASFSGNITNIDKVNFTKDGTYKANVKGTLKMHGEEKEVETDGVIKVKGDQVTTQAEFTITLEDYKINIPSVVKDKLSKTVKISVDCDYSLLK